MKLLMNIVGGLLRFLRDLIIGDSVPVAAAVCVIVAAGAGVLRAQVLPTEAFAVVFGTVVMIVVAFVVVIEVSVGQKD